MVAGPGGKERWVLAVCLLAGALLTLIGIRYLLIPRAAAITFGVPGRPAGYELHYIIGLRNVWLGLLAIGFALLRQWLALTLWFGMGTLVCLADAVIVGVSTGKPAQLAFHIGSGIVCLIMTLVIVRIARREA